MIANLSQSQASVAAAPDGMLNAIGSHLDNNVAHLRDHLDRLAMIIDRVFGAKPPEPTGQPHPTEVPNGAVQRIEFGTNDLSVLLARLGDQVDRLAALA